MYKPMQLEFFTGQEARDAGIQQAITHADEVVPDWSNKAYDLLKRYLSLHPGEFMTEQVRAFADLDGFPEPPSKRAWGGIIRKAAKQNLIRQVGIGQVKNPRARCANAAVWTHNVPFVPNDDNDGWVPVKMD